MKVTLSEFERTGVIAVGGVILDHYWYDSTNRISLEVPVPAVKVNTTEERPDGTANVATSIAPLSANARLVGLTGIDDVARALSKSLADVSIKCGFVSVPTYPAITKLRVLSRSQQLIRLGFEEGFEGVDPQPLHERINQVLSLIDALVLSDYAKGALASVRQMIQLTRKAGVPVLTDSEGTDLECCHGAMLLTPNLSEFEAAVSKYKTEEEIVERGMRLIADCELSTLLVIRSEQGMSLLQPGRAPLHMLTQVQGVCDVTGAGNTTIGVPMAALAAGNSLKEACFLASAAADVVADKLGTSMVLPIELGNAVRGRIDTGLDMMTGEELKLTVVATRKRDEGMVMTNGVSDILHAGHVSYLANARKLDDRLIVAVSSDASTKRLKGDSRPVNPLEQCMIVLGALEMVDWVVSFGEDTPQHLTAGVLSGSLVRGNDYRPEEIAGSKEVWANGGEVLVLNSENGCSTTNITEKTQ